jgi:hypothetical protein
MDKSNVIKNPKRKTVETHKPYVQEYKRLGYTPTAVPSGVVQNRQKTIVIPTTLARDNPRIRKSSAFRQNLPYATVPSDESISIGTMPNVGNNIERTWADTDAFDDFSTYESNEQVDPNHPMIDNNEDDPNNYADIPEVIQAAPEPHQEGDTEESDNQSFQIENNQYVLLVFGNILKIGTLEEVQSEVQKLIFGEHDLNLENSITTDDIIVLKRVNIKVGVFIE